MWLATKLAAGKPKIPPLAMLQDQLGNTEDAILYRRLAEDHPQVERGPDETLSDHFSRLKSAQESWRARDTTDATRRRRDPRTKPAKGKKPTKSWGTDLPEFRPPSGLPQRDPGFFTSPVSQSREFGVPPLPKRDPGASLRAPVTPSAVPSPQSMNDWMKWLADKGIYLDSDGRRRTEPRRALTGPEIWHPFTRPAPEPAYAGRHRAARAAAASYIKSVLDREAVEIIRLAGSVHDTMTGEGWSYHESGSGDWYQKKIGDKVHVIVRQDDGWIHNSGPTENEMTGMPIMFNDLQGALMHVNRGKPQVGFRPPPPHQQSLSSNSWSDE